MFSKIKIPKHTKHYQFKMFFIKLLVFVAFLSLLDYVIGNTLRYLYFKQTTGANYRTYYSLNKTRADILIFGSSRANHHYYPTIFEDKLGMSCYNVGREGIDMFYYYALLGQILERYTPKIIILDIKPDEFAKSQSSYDRLSCLLPYYDEFTEIRPILYLRSKYENYKLLSKVYPYNSQIVTIIGGIFAYNSEKKEDLNGYIYFNKVWHKPIEEDSLNESIIDTLKVNYYNLFIQDCKRHHIKLYIVCSPSYIHFVYKKASLILAEEIAERNNIPFIGFSNNEFFLTNPELFTNPNHLNTDGAKVFTTQISDSISLIKYTIN
jgi:hypothetical protein